MNPQDTGDGHRDACSRSLARLAVLQRLREEAIEGHRTGMLHSIEHLIELEADALRQEHADSQKHPARG